MAAKYGSSKVIFEFDSTQCVVDIKNPNTHHPLINIISRIKSLMEANRQWSIAHVSREANGTADFLAKRALTVFYKSGILHLPPPPDVLPLLQCDLFAIWGVGVGGG
ncbi:hypothetical protein U1Q18_017052 [Sarracenia purpurea var. burkii]